jgi:hypothetical protein
MSGTTGHRISAARNRQNIWMRESRSPEAALGIAGPVPAYASRSTARGARAVRRR